MTTSPQLSKPARLMIRQMTERLGRQPTPKEVIEAARPADSPLHPYFEWDVPKFEAEQTRRQRLFGDNADR